MSMGDKIIETLYSNRVTSEENNSHPTLLHLHSKLMCLAFSTGSLYAVSYMCTCVLAYIMDLLAD